MNAQKLFVIIGLGASIVALAYPEPPTNHAAVSSSLPSAASGAEGAATATRPSALDTAAKEEATLVSLPVREPTIAEKMLVDNNAIRAAAKTPMRPQPLDERLCKAAQDHADFMVRFHQPRPNRWYFNPEYRHEGNGGGVMARANRYGFHGLDVRENINLSLPGHPDDAWQSWINSAPHYGSILSPCEKVGFGKATASDGSIYSVAVYGTEQAAGVPPSELESLRAKVAEQAQTIRQLQEQISRLTPGYVPKPQQAPVKQAPTQAPAQAPVTYQYRSYSSCSGPGCGSSGRRGLFGWRN